MSVPLDPSVLVLQHVECEDLGSIEASLVTLVYGLNMFARSKAKQYLMNWANILALIVLGGPMSAYDHGRYGHLREELGLIERAMAQDCPILGVCLGSQLLAAALGGEVAKHSRKEIGWHPIRMSTDAASDALFAETPTEFTALHWHGDIFIPPAGAVSLASSALTRHQAFRYGRSAYGILFHLEVTQASIEGMLETFADEVKAEGLRQETIRQDASMHLPDLSRIGSQVFDRWVRLIEPSLSTAGR